MRLSSPALLALVSLFTVLLPSARCPAQKAIGLGGSSIDPEEVVIVPLAQFDSFFDARLVQPAP